MSEPWPVVSDWMGNSAPQGLRTPNHTRPVVNNWSMNYAPGTGPTPFDHIKSLLQTNFTLEHKTFVRFLQRQKVNDDEISTRLQATFPDAVQILEGGDENNRAGAYNGFVAIFTSMWAPPVDVSNAAVVTYAWGNDLVAEFKSSWSHPEVKTQIEAELDAETW